MQPAIAYDLVTSLESLFEILDQADEGAVLLSEEDHELMFRYVQSRFDDFVERTLALDSEEEHYERLIKKFTEARDVVRRKRERRVDWLRFAMQKARFEKFSGNAFTAKLRTSESVAIKPEAAKPDAALIERYGHFVRLKTDAAWDKIAIKNALKSGLELPFASIEKSQSPVFDVKRGSK